MENFSIEEAIGWIAPADAIFLLVSRQLLVFF